MSGQHFDTKTEISACGCGGVGIVWDRPSAYGDGVGTIEAFCSHHCGIGVNPHVYQPGDDRPRRKIGNKVVRIWNRAMSGEKR